MKNAAKFLLGATLLAAATAASAGEFLTVDLKARVTSVEDPAGVFGGQVEVGQLLTGAYTYDIHVPDEISDPYFGNYVQPQASVKLVAGPLVFESEASSTNLAVWVAPSAAPGDSLSFFQVTSEANKPLPNGAPVVRIAFNFRDSTGHEPASDALPTTGPSLHTFDGSSAHVYGEMNGQSYSIQLEIESTYSAGTASDLVISPGKSTFVSGQRFDVALLLPPGSDIVHATSSIDGSPLPMSFRGGCNLAYSQSRPAIICPDAHLHLPAVPGQYRVDWEVELSDGTTIWNPVDWTLAQ